MAKLIYPMNENRDNYPYVESDWIGTYPVYYNTSTGKVDRNFHAVVDYADLEFDPEGFNDYLDFGYSVFGRTPIRNVRILRHSARAYPRDSQPPSIVHLPDPAEDWCGHVSEEGSLIELMQDRVHAWESNQQGVVVVPTSGGYDSRLLNWLVGDKSRIRAFSYGLSVTQSDSFETVYAQRVCQKLGIQWKHIALGGYHDFMDEWEDLFGASVHCHGMYHMEFYREVLQDAPPDSALLTGIFGDVWAGNVEPLHLRGPEDLWKLGYTHGLHADSSYSRLPSRSDAREEFWEMNGARINDRFWQIINVIRLKIVLISYLLRVPEEYGFRPWSPFLDMDVALGMLCLPRDRWSKRRWQQELFERESLDVESLGLHVDRRNELNFHALKNRPFKPLNAELLREVVEPAYVEWINRTARVSNPTALLSHRLQGIPRVGGALRFAGVRDRLMNAYWAYLTLWPIQRLMERRNRGL